MREVIFNSFSGGRTSAYMSHLLTQEYSDKFEVISVFANTGLEDEATLEFVDRCDKEWGLNIHWVEADVNPEKGAPITFKRVTFETASRKGEPFYELCKKHGVPNSGRPFCTQYLKTYVINAFKASLGYKRNHKTAIGIRADEFDRINYNQLESGQVIYPLISLKHTTKQDVLLFFKENHFDLELDELYGNCVACFKKSDRHLMTIAKHRRSAFDLWQKIETEFGHIDAKDGDPYRFYRGNKTVGEIIASSEQPFKEFDPTMKEFQIGFDFGTDIDPLDKVDDCFGACGV